MDDAESVGKRLGSLISLARKANKLVSGESACQLALKKQKAMLVIISRDAADNTKKKFFQKAYYYKCPYYEYGEKHTLASLIGEECRSVIAVTDEGFASGMEKLLDQIIK